jgi:CRP/FNR family transcriptional regulator, cyclic AMP receptor protein
MVSPELLRRFPFFGIFNDNQLKKIAMISEEINVPTGTKLFDECAQANALYLLVDGSIDLMYKSEEEFHPKTKKVFPVGEINPEEVFGISSVLEPYEYKSTALASKDSKILRIDGENLRKLMKEDPEFGCSLMHQIARVIMERLTYTRIQLAAAWA